MTVKVTAPVLPTVAEAGERLVMAGAAVMTNVLAPELTPSALCTVICALPAAKRSDEGTMASREVALAYNELNVDVVDPWPTVVHFTTLLLLKLVPVMVIVRPASPAAAVAGEMLEMVGLPLMVSAALAEATPSAFTTVMLPLPAVARSTTGTVAVMEVAFTYVDASGVLPPFHATVDALVKLAPVMVTRRSGLPAVTLDGERLVMAGAFAIVNASELETMPSKLVRVMVALPAFAAANGVDVEGGDFHGAYSLCASAPGRRQLRPTARI